MALLRPAGSCCSSTERLTTCRATGLRCPHTTQAASLGSPRRSLRARRSAPMGSGRLIDVLVIEVALGVPALEHRDIGLELKTPRARLAGHAAANRGSAEDRERLEVACLRGLDG